MQTRPLAALGALLATFGLLSAQSASCYEPDFGTLVGNGDDMLFPASNLGFSFPFAGTSFTQIRISTNGFVHLGNNGTSSGCCASAASLLVSQPARIAVLWTDLVVDPPGGVYLKTLPGIAVVTWHRAVEYGIGTNFTLQLQLVSDGTITMWYHPATAIVDFYHQCLTGVSPGNGAVDPGSIDITASLPFNSNTQPTIYEEWVNPPWFDLGGRALAFLPNGTNGYVLVDRGCPFAASTAPLVGHGCPALLLPNAEFYELFGAGSMDLGNSAIELIPTGTGYVVQQSAAAFVPPTNALVMGDDQVIVQALGFTFTHPGGSITSVGQCSNGFLWLDNGLSTITTYTPSVSELLQQGPRFCAVWVDLNPSSGGTVYYDTTPTSALFTWSNVELYASSIDHVTFQVQLHNDGRIIVVYQSMSVIEESIVGYSRGGNVPDPGSVDLSASMPFPTGTGTTSVPVRLIPLSSPAIGGTFTLSAIDLPAATLLGLLVLGLTPVSIDLSGLGMPGCTLYETLDATLAFPAASPSANQSINIPNATTLVGFAMRAQVAVLVPGINPFGFVTTNAVAVTVGTF